MHIENLVATTLMALITKFNSKLHHTVVMVRSLLMTRRTPDLLCFQSADLELPLFTPCPPPSMSSMVNVFSWLYSSNTMFKHQASMFLTAAALT